jgi:hypothetical protein
MWLDLINEAYSRPLAEGDTAFWACLRRAFPEGVKGGKVDEALIANTGVRRMTCCRVHASV